MAGIRLNDGGTLRLLRGAKINDGGTLRSIKGIRINDGGTLRYIPFSQLVTPMTLPDFAHRNAFAIAPNDADALVSVTIKRDGGWLASVGMTDQSGDWHLSKTSTVGDGYEVRVTHLSGDSLYSNGATAWTALNTNRTFQQRATVTTNFGSSEKITAVLVEIRSTSNPSDIVSKQMTVEATASVEQ